MKKEIEEILRKEFQVESLEIINNSHLHQGHLGDDGSGNTHFKIEIKAQEFKNLPRLKTHRLINKALESLFKKGLHALEIKIKN